MSDMVSSFKKCVDSILGIREKIGADLRKVWIVERRWTGERLGLGDSIESMDQVVPTPRIVDLSHDLRVQTGGQYKAGDLIISHISKNQYCKESDVDCSSDDPLLEKLYKIGDYYYRVVHVKEKHVTWDIHVRRLVDQPNG